MKRAFLFARMRSAALTVAGAALVAATYGLVRFAFGLYLPDMERDLAVGPGLAGAIAAGGSLSYCAGAAVGFLLGSARPRLLILAAGAAAGLGALGMALAPAAEVLAPAAVLSSAGAGLASPALVTVIRRSRRAGSDRTAQSIVNAGTGPGLAAAGVLALAVLPDWRLAWATAAAITVLAAASVLLLDRLTAPRASGPDASGSAASDTGAGESGGSGAGEGGRVDPPRVGMARAAWLRAHRLPLLLALLLGAGTAAVWTYGRTHLVDAGVDEAGSVAAWIALGLGGGAAALTAPLLSRIPPARAWMLAVISIAAAAALLAVAPQLLALSFAACAVFGWGYTAATAALIGWTSGIHSPRAAAGTALLFITMMAGQAGGSLGSAGLLPLGETRLALLASAGVCVVAAALATRAEAVPSGAAASPASAGPATVRSR